MRSVQDIARDLRGAGVVKLTFIRGEDIVRLDDGPKDAIGLQLRDGTLAVLDSLAVRLLVRKRLLPGPLVPEPGTPAGERAAALRSRESDPHKTSGGRF